MLSMDPIYSQDMYVFICPVIYLFIIVPCFTKMIYGNFKSMWNDSKVI